MKTLGILETFLREDSQFWPTTILEVQGQGRAQGWDGKGGVVFAFWLQSYEALTA